MKKAILLSFSILLVLAVLTAAFPMSAMAAGTTTTPASLTATVVGNKVVVKSVNPSSNTVYFVRARKPTTTTGGGWDNLGKFMALKNKTSQRSFLVPKDLKGVLPLEVCFRDFTTDKNIAACQIVKK